MQFSYSIDNFQHTLPNRVYLLNIGMDHLCKYILFLFITLYTFTYIHLSLPKQSLNEPKISTRHIEVNLY